MTVLAIILAILAVFSLLLIFKAVTRSRKIAYSVLTPIFAAGAIFAFLAG